ncbi:DUF2057 family protein [Solimonas sp. SE-A11]|uniref:DUF2057 family protein n=1 Tax=Solimonas sp. SE-A11 TaxID=3054954 RepID=UPI00259C7D18|nr:DUF2057 family protein [Solimonas sp. SE-A11]MDM4770070.1 DUF2057 family protein [Solimonas sp. SE-A11]
MFAARRLMVLTLILLCSACAQRPIQLYDGNPAGTATISMPEQLEVEQLNGKPVRGAKGMFTRGDKNLEVAAPGRYELMVFYREVLNPQGEHEVAKSDPELFVVDAVPGHRYRLDYERPRNTAEARQLAADFKGWIEDQNTGVRTASTDSGLAFDRSIGAALQPGSKLISASEQQPGAKQIIAPLAIPPAAASATAVSIPAPALVPAVVPAPAAGSASAPAKPAADIMERLPLLKAWWKQASVEERKQALRWVGDDVEQGGSEYLASFQGLWRQARSAERRDFVSWAGSH